VSAQPAEIPAAHAAAKRISREGEGVRAPDRREDKASSQVPRLDRERDDSRRAKGEGEEQREADLRHDHKDLQPARRGVSGISAGGCLQLGASPAEAKQQ
jgi:hypothetical protein